MTMPTFAEVLIHNFQGADAETDFVQVLEVLLVSVVDGKAYDDVDAEVEVTAAADYTRSCTPSPACRT